ncbi:MAG: F420-dependent methylene-tetrahydromethanopterin reductase [Gammaproteobacteria bacterium]|nr:F420-dependent methylene-tetrahydromethanopterin reductase [Gammaproteobacteria bacterium]
MQTAIGIGGAASGRKRDWQDNVDFVVASERLGADFVWSAEAWGMDAVVPVAYLAARTSTIKLGTGIMQISARTPSMTAMTALTMAAVSDDRFVLGLGASGPQVVEGLQGVPFKAPITRMRETMEICRLAFAGEKIQYDGKYHQLPLPGGEGKALRLSQPGNDNIGIYLASLSPKSLALTGALADGWVGTSFSPDTGAPVIQAIAEAASAAGRSIADVDLQVGGGVAFTDDIDALIAPQKAGMAFQLGAMGSAEHNFYNDAFKRQGFEEDAIAVQQLWLQGKRDAAIDRVPDDMILKTNLFGTEEMVRERIRAYSDIGINTLRLTPMGATATERLDTLGRAIELVREES